MSIIKGSENIQILSGLVANNLRKSYGKRLVV